MTRNIFVVTTPKAAPAASKWRVRMIRAEKWKMSEKKSIITVIFSLWRASRRREQKK